MGRPTTSRWLSALVFTSGAVGACNGPISDFPSATDNRGPGNGGTPDGVRNPPDGGASGGVIPPPLTGGIGGAGTDNENPSVPGDGGGSGGFIGGGLTGDHDAGSWVPPQDAGAGVEADDGGGEADGGEDAGTDAGEDANLLTVPAPDACPLAARDDARCDGSLCGTDLAPTNVPEGVCTDPEALGLACDGQLARSAVECAQVNTASLWFERAVQRCLHGDVRVEAASRECLDCYSAEILCTLTHCLVSCVSGLEEACSSCRSAKCGVAFAACSGLPKPYP